MGKELKWYSFAYEMAYAKEDFRKQAKSNKDVAEDIIENLTDERIIQDIKGELNEAFSKEDIELMEFRAIQFEEFDSNRWHGSGYFSYEVWAPSLAQAVAWLKAFNEWLNLN